MMIKPEFTEEQQQYLAEIIDYWYMYWAGCLITGDGGQHKLGYAKERLKAFIYWPENTRFMIDLFFEHGMYTAALDLLKRYPELENRGEHDYAD